MITQTNSLSLAVNLMMNKIQKMVFDYVITNTEHQEQHKTNLCKCNQAPGPIRLFCSGVGGMIFFNKNSLTYIFKVKK